MSEQFLQQIHSGAKKLLEIAFENDKAKLLFDNKSLSNGLQTLSKLHELSKMKKTDQIAEWLRLPAKRDNTFFVQFIAAFIKALHTVSPKGTRVEITDYDHFVLMASAETLSDIMWEDKRNPDIPGPPFNDCLDEYAFQGLSTILQVFIKNYIGNILQHLFEAGKIRMANPKLPPETEVELKEKEAAAIAGYVFADLNLGTNVESNAKKIIDKLNLAQYLILSRS